MAVVNVLGERADEIGPELMESVNGGLRKFPPVAGKLERAARRLLGIWAALQVVDVSSSCACVPNSNQPLMLSCSSEQPRRPSTPRG